MNLDETWRGLDAGLSTRTQEGPFKCEPMADRRVSAAEQEEDRPLPFGAQFPWSVVLLGLSPLLTIGAVSLVAALLSR